MGAIDLPRYKARTLVEYDIDQMFAIPDDLFVLGFDNGETIITTKQRTIWSWFLWEIHRVFPKTPILLRHHIREETLSPKTHINLLSIIKTDCKVAYELDGSYDDTVGIYEVIHKAFNDMYNVLTVKLEAYVGSANAVDVLNVLKHPDIYQANNIINTTPDIEASVIDEQHDVIERVLKSDVSLIGNSVAVALRNNLVRGKQLLQCISARGFMSDVDNQNFRVPMLSSYSTGMRKLTNYACDSRMASVAAYAQQATMRDFQYVNRTFQLLDGDIANLHRVDCGTTSYTTVVVDSMKKLEQYLGMYRMDDNGKWVLIDIRDQSLLNKPLRLRTIVDCAINDRHGVCIKCFGELGTGMIEGDNLGQFVASVVQERQSQGALSVKHYSGNASDSVHELDENLLGFFVTDPNDPNSILVTPEYIANGGRIILAAEEVEAINNIADSSKLTDISISRYSTINNIILSWLEPDGERNHKTVDISGGTEAGFLTRPAIAYLLNGHVTILPDNNWQLDLSQWNPDDPFIRLPRKKVDTVQEAKKFDTFLKGIKVKKGAGHATVITQFNEFGDALMALQDLTIDASPIPVSHLQVMMYALLAADPENDDYRLPHPFNRKNAKFVTLRDKVTYGNIATALAYERQGLIITAPSSYIIKKRSNSDFEYFVSPGELYSGGNLK